MTNRPVAVGFDFDHTLGIDHHLERHAFGRLARELGWPVDIEEPELRDLIERLLTGFRTAEISMERMLWGFTAALPPSEGGAGRSAEALVARYREICFTLVDEMVRPLEGAVECITQLVDHGFRVGILTNGWSPLQEKKIAKALGYFPGPVLVSEAIGAYKPSAEAFRRLASALACSASELWYVGDNAVADIDGARSYGLPAIWLADHAAPYPMGLRAPTARIDRLAALVPIVRGG
jgi:FMN phosphatase YigB (HAD superfamily)